MELFLRSMRMAAGGILIALFLSSAQAHHSRATFSDTSRQIEGEVVHWSFSNPHATLVVRVEDEDGSTTEWELEGGSNPSSMARAGWTHNSVRPGDRVAVTMFPMNSGAPGGLFENDSVRIFREGGPEEGFSPTDER